MKQGAKVPSEEKIQQVQRFIALRDQGYTITRIAKELGIAQSSASSLGVAISAVSLATVSHATQGAPSAKKQCQDCGASIPADAKFCHLCGKPYLTARQRAEQSLEKLSHFVPLIPENNRDAFVRCLNVIRASVEQENAS